MWQPMVSIVTTSYNKFDKLKETIDSVIGQTYSNIEYIFSDDCSKEDICKEVVDYIEKNKKNNITDYHVIRHEKNVGTVKNLNNAFKLAKGEIIIPLSCNDVFFDNEVIQKIVDAFAKSNAKVISTSALKYTADFCPFSIEPHILERGAIMRLDTHQKQYTAFIMDRFHEMASGCSMAYLKEYMEQCGYFDERYRLWEDGPFIAKFTWENKIEFCFDIISIWYQAGGISDSKSVIPKEVSDSSDKDSILFFENEIFEHYNQLSGRTRRFLDYRKKKMGKSTWKKNVIRLLYFDVFLSNVVYSLLHRLWPVLDEYYIRRNIVWNREGKNE